MLFRSSVEGEDGDFNGRVDGLMWYKDLGKHVYGEFSMAVIQANSSLEDRCQLESGPFTSSHLGPQGTFIGVYDGHGGSEASQFVADNLFFHLKSMLFLNIFRPKKKIQFFWSTYYIVALT